MKTLKTFPLSAFLLLACAARATAFGGPSVDDLIRRGDDAYYDRHYAKSESYYEEAARKRPRDAIPRVLRGRLYYAMTRYAQAREEFEAALRMNPNVEVKKFLDTALAHLQENADVLRRIEKTPDTPENLPLLVSLHEAAAASMQDGRFYMALLGHHLRYILDADPQNSELRGRIADAYYLSSDPVSAAVLYEELSRVHPRDMALLTRLADIYVTLGRFDQAAISYKKAMRQAVRKKNSADCTKLLKLLQTLPPSIGKVRSLIEDKEDLKSALAGLKRRVELNRSDLWAITLMGSVYEEMDKNGKAERLYRKVLKADPEFPYVHFYMGRMLLLKKKKFEAAAQELLLFKKYLRAAAQRPGTPGKFKEGAVKDLIAASRYLSYIYGEVLQKRTAAINEIREAMTLSPGNAELYYDLGVTYSRAKKRASAYAAFKKVIEIAPKEEIAKDAKEAIDIIRSQSDYGSYTNPYS